ncbi:hypothetical protein HAX54_035545, partial [Datura stramonium]|nr:hypothetical protein [Datura stramonium]
MVPLKPIGMLWGQRLSAIHRSSPAKHRWNVVSIYWWLQATDLIPHYIGSSRSGTNDSLFCHRWK